MIFSSNLFLLGFLPLFLVMNILTPTRRRNTLLLLASILFYFWGEELLVLLLLLSATIDFLAGILIMSGFRRTGVILSIAINLSLLVAYKYAYFILENINALLGIINWPLWESQLVNELSLPLGISFFTFQTMSYTLDVYHGRIKAEKNYLDFITYVTMFPQLVAGPIVRFSEIRKDLKKRKIALMPFIKGADRFIVGLAKKVLIANTLAVFTDSVLSQDISQLSSFIAFLGLLVYTLQIYFDFSGYSDMAIGLGLMIGIRFPENFRHPYASCSLREFWTRWHITLSMWFKDYLYIPLGGSRKSPMRTHLNLCFVFVVTGFWHGASWNFVIWGMLHGVFLILERNGLTSVLQMFPRPISHIYTLSVIVLTFVFFITDSFSDAIEYFEVLFIWTRGNVALSEYMMHAYIDSQFVFVFVVAIIFSLPLKRLKQTTLFKSIRPGIILILLILCMIYLNSQSHNPFIYFRF